MKLIIYTSDKSYYSVTQKPSSYLTRVNYLVTSLCRGGGSGGGGASKSTIISVIDMYKA